MLDIFKFTSLNTMFFYLVQNNNEKKCIVFSIVVIEHYK